MEPFRRFVMKKRARNANASANQATEAVCLACESALAKEISLSVAELLFILRKWIILSLYNYNIHKYHTAEARVRCFFPIFRSLFVQYSHSNHLAIQTLIRTL